MATSESRGTVRFPADFKLYDVARRALNCLTLLYAAPEESLIPVTVSEFQKQLVQNISNYSQLTATLGNAAQAQSEPTTPNQPAASQGGEVQQDNPGLHQAQLPRPPSLPRIKGTTRSSS